MKNVKVIDARGKMIFSGLKKELNLRYKRNSVYLIYTLDKKLVVKNFVTE